MLWIKTLRFQYKISKANKAEGKLKVDLPIQQISPFL